MTWNSSLICYAGSAAEASMDLRPIRSELDRAHASWSIRAIGMTLLYYFARIGTYILNRPVLR